MQASRHSRPLPLTATASTMLETAKENEATMFQTVLTERMNLRAPIVAAPIGRGANPQFLGAVATAGALPFIALTHLPEDTMLETLRDCANHAGGPGRFGINLALIKDQHCRLDRALEAGLRTVSLWRGDPTTYTRKAKRAGATIFWTIGSTSEARRAADLGVDFLVAQGREAGGHLVGSAPTMSLLPAVVAAAGDVPVIAAGGIANGKGLAAALALGACGVWMGTRFVASVESANHAGYKKCIVEAVASDVVETSLFNLAGNSPQSVIRNSTFRAWEDAGHPPSDTDPEKANASAPILTGGRFCVIPTRQRGKDMSATGRHAPSTPAPAAS